MAKLDAEQKREVAERFYRLAIWFGGRSMRYRPGMAVDRDENVSLHLWVMARCLESYDGPTDEPDWASFKKYLECCLRRGTNRLDNDYMRALRNGSSLAFYPSSASMYEPSPSLGFDGDSDHERSPTINPEEARHGPDREAEGHEVGEAIDECIGLLPPDEAAVVRLVLFERMSISEVAASQGRKKTWTEERRRRGLSGLRSLLAERYPGLLSSYEISPCLN